MAGKERIVDHNEPPGRDTTFRETVDAADMTKATGVAGRTAAGLKASAPPPVTTKPRPKFGDFKTPGEFRGAVTAWEQANENAKDALHATQTEAVKLPPLKD